MNSLLCVSEYLLFRSHVFLHHIFFLFKSFYLLFLFLLQPKEVTQRRVRLVLRVLVAFTLFWYVINHPGQLSLAIPSWVGAMSTSDGLGHC